MLLTIAIPTYNRLPQVSARVAELLPQLSPEVELLVVDNASEPPVPLTEFAASLADSRFRIVRNSANIGLAANICRCIEQARGEWVWVLGDDDAVNPCAIRDILLEIEHIKNEERISYISFSSGIYVHSQRTSVYGQKAFWERMQEPMFFSNCLFLSSGVHRRAVFNRYLAQAYLSCASVAPHFAVGMAAVRDGWGFRLSSCVIVGWVRAGAKEHWNWVTVTAGLPLLADIPGCQMAYKKIGRGLLVNGSVSLRLADALKFIFYDDKRGPAFWYAYYSRLATCLTGSYCFRALVFRTIAGLARSWPAIHMVGKQGLRLWGASPIDTEQGLHRI